MSVFFTVCLYPPIRLPVGAQVRPEPSFSSLASWAEKAFGAYVLQLKRFPARTRARGERPKQHICQHVALFAMAPLVKQKFFASLLRLAAEDVRTFISCGRCAAVLKLAQPTSCKGRKQIIKY